MTPKVIFYQIYGKGNTVLFIHGWAHSSKVWLKIIKKLSDKFECILVDLPGFGNSLPLIKEKITIDNYTLEIEKLLEKIFISEKAISIVSDSLGAIIALRLIQNDRVNINKVVLTGCPIDGLPFFIKCLQKSGLIFILLKSMKIFSFSIAKYFIKKSISLTSAKPETINEDVLESIYRADVPTSNKMLHLLATPIENDFTDLNNKGISYCIIRGKLDKVVSSETSHKLADRLSGSYIEIENSGHTPMQENPQSYLYAILNFLKK